MFKFWKGGIIFLLFIFCSGCGTVEKKNNEKAALANVELGMGYLAQGEIAQAKSKLIHAMELSPKTAETHSAMAYFLEKVGDKKNAYLEHKKALQISSKGNIANNYGAFLCREQKYSEADQLFNLALQDKKYPNTGKVYENAGICALKAGNKIQAEHYLTAAIQYDPKGQT